MKNSITYILILTIFLVQSAYAMNPQEVLVNDSPNEFVSANVINLASVDSMQIVMTFQFSDFSGFPISSPGASDGSIDMTVAGGVSPYSYVWSTGETSEDVCGLEEGAYTVWVFDSNGNFGTQSFNLKCPDQQTIILPAGWSIISSYLELTNSNISDVFSDVVSNLMVVKDGYGNFYWPQYGVNYIGNLVVGAGYFVNMVVTETLVLGGSILQPEYVSIEVPYGWSIIGYIRTVPGYIPDMLAPIVNDIDIVKNSAGLIYWPALNINMIGDMIPNEGYMIKMLATEYLTYPANPFIPDDQFCPYHMIDYDYNVYNVAQIGDQCWMKENLETTHYADGTSLADGAGVGNITGDYSSKYYFDYNDNSLNSDVYGKLYTWAATMNVSLGIPAAQGVCPTGWHVPTESDWIELQGSADSQYNSTSSEWLNSGYLGSDAGGNLKEDGFSHWNSPNTGGTNSTGFSAIPAGYRMMTGTYLYQGNSAYFWTDADQYTYNAWSRKLSYNNDKVYSGFYNKSNAFSVRCIQDQN